MKRFTLLLSVALSLTFVSCTSDEGASDDFYTGSGEELDGNYTVAESLEVYDYPDVIVEDNGLGYLKRSEFFSVEVSNSTDTKEVYVMADRNQYQSTTTTAQTKMMTNHNHTANFSFSGEVTIKVKRLDGGSLEGVEVFPKVKDYQYTVESDHVAITLDEWAYIFVEFPDLESEEPLFIFADPKETSVPNTSASTVEVITNDMSIYEIKALLESSEKSTFYFSPGVYDFAPTITDSSYPGYQIPLVSSKSYYIAGGAVIIGSFYSTSCSNHKMYGRGVVTTSGKERIEDSAGIPYTLYYQEGGDGCTLEGIHFCAPSHFAVLSRNNLYTTNCKMMGWWHQTDGWGGGDYAVVENCFMKADDDFVKLYNYKQEVRNIVMYKQINGAAIQFGWGSGGSAQDGIVDGIYIVGEDKRSPGGVNNSAIINLVDNGGSTISNISISNVYVDDDYQRLFGLNNNGGNITGLTLDNIQVTGENLGGSNYLAYSTGTTGTYSNVTIRNMVINGEAITADDQWLLTQGKANAAANTVAAEHLVDILYE